MNASSFLHATVGLLAFLLAGCGAGGLTGYKGYKKVDGQWAYVTTNVNGTNVHKIDADPDTFQTLTDVRYGKDNKQVFFRGRVIRDADPASFVLLSEIDYAKDDYHVFIQEHQVRGADPASFKIIRPPYGRDAAKIYCGTLPMNVAHPDKFEPVPVRLDGGWVIVGDRRSFVQVWGDDFANVDVSLQRPVVTSHAWARDGEHYYHGPARVADADYATFSVKSSLFAADKNTEFVGPFTKAARAEWNKRVQEKQK
jgi:hypothetical protein